MVAVGGVDAARRVADGEGFDFVVLAADAIEQLAAGGRVDPGSRTDLARSAVAIAVAAGATRPDVSTESTIRDALMRARSIGYSTGPSGAHLIRLFERWGIADAIAPRIVQAPPGIPVGTLVARGDVELGFQQLSELMHVPGIDVIGLLPPEIQVSTVFSGAVCTASNRPAAAKALLSFLASPDADAAKRRHGMEPA
jgi:molybdate transport system substrate-binding protein